MTRIAPTYTPRHDGYPYRRELPTHSVVYELKQGDGGAWELHRNGRKLTRASSLREGIALSDWFVLNDGRVRQSDSDSILDLIIEAKAAVKPKETKT